jgi:hypothetical protein
MLKDEWVPADSATTAKMPLLKFFQDVACTTPLEVFDFKLVDRGTAANLPFYLRNMSDKTIYDLAITATPEPDKDWQSNQKAYGPMTIKVTPAPPAEFKPGYVYAGKFIWQVNPKEKFGKRRASVLVSGRWTEI